MVDRIPPQHPPGPHELVSWVKKMVSYARHDDQGLIGIGRLFRLSDSQPPKPVANGRAARDDLVDVQPLKKHGPGSRGSSNANRADPD